MRRVLATAVSCWLALSLARVVHAQVITGSILGTVRDESSAVLPGVTVTLRSPVLPSGPATIVTNDQGEYRFINLRPGSYTINVSLQGFATYQEEGLVVLVGGTTERAVTLKVATMDETINVSGQSPIVDTERVAVTTNLPQHVIENIPSVRYGFHEYVKWAPGVAATNIQGTSGDASVLGSATTENLFLYDGVNTNDPSNGSLWLGGAVNAIQEVQVVTLGASAEYQTAQGAVFNSVTKSGTNSYHGEYDQFWFNNSLISHPIQLPCNCPQGMTGYNQIFRTDLMSDVGGPLIKDKLWFFGAVIYNNRKETNPGVDPNIPFKYYQKSVLGKASWHPNPSTSIEGMYNPKWRDTPPIPTPSQPIATINGSDGRSRTFNLQLTSTLAKNTVLTVRGGGYLDPDAYNAPFTATGALQDPAVAGLNSYRTDQVTGIACCGAPSISLTTFYRWGESARLNHFIQTDRMSHDIGVGAQFEQANRWDYNALPGGANYQDVNGKPSQATLRSAWVDGAGYHQLGVWGQDRMNISRLTLDLGVRWDRQHAYSPDEPQINNLLQPIGTTVKGLGDMFTWSTVAPRLGANYRLTNDGKTILRGSYGRAYRPIFLNDFTIIYPGISPSTLAAFDAATGGYTKVISVTNPISNIRLDPNLKDPHTDSISVGIDRELVRNMALNVSYVHKKGLDQVGWTDIGGLYGTQMVTLQNGQLINVNPLLNATSARILERTNGPGFFNRYNGVVFAVEKRISHGWQANFSYTYSKSEGLTGGNTGGSSSGQDPNAYINGAGRLSTDRPHVFMTNGTYQLPKIDGAVAVNFIAESGTPFAPQALVRLPQGNTTINLAPPDGSYRLASQEILYFRYIQTVLRRGSKRIELWAELANVLQNKGDLSIISQNIFASTFNQPNSWTLPRRLYFSTAVKF